MTKDLDRSTWNEMCLSLGLKAISTDTAARIMAVLYVHGNNEQFTFNKRFLADLEYITKAYRIEGSLSPDAGFCELVKKYADELDAYYWEHQGDQKGNGALFHDAKPRWALDLFRERYNITLIN